MNDIIREQIELEFESNKDSALQSLLGTLSTADYSEISESIKMEVCSFLNTNLSTMHISDTEGSLDSPVGTIDCAISSVGIKIKNTSVDDDLADGFASNNVKVDITTHTVDIIVENFSCYANNAIWWFEKQTFPKMSDSGSANIWLSGCVITLKFDVRSVGLGIPAISVRSLDFDIQDVDIGIQQTNFSWLYNLLVRMLRSKIKSKICAEVKESVQNSLEVLTGGINKLGTQLLDDADERT